VAIQVNAYPRCFFAGGVRFAEQTIKSTAAQLNASLLLIAVIAVLIPSAFHFSITTSATGEGDSLTDTEEGNDLLAMSHAVAIILLILYLAYLLFQMWTHATLYADDTVSSSTLYPASVTDRVKRYTLRKKNDEEVGLGSPTGTSGEATNEHNPNIDGPVQVPRQEEPEEEEEEPQMNIIATMVRLLALQS
jgi:Ca2+:H+ antiporter